MIYTQHTHLYVCLVNMYLHLCVRIEIFNLEISNPSSKAYAHKKNILLWPQFMYEYDDFTIIFNKEWQSALF